MIKKTVFMALCILTYTSAFAQNTFTFLHYSDAHKSTEARSHAAELMESDESIKFTIDTGDMWYDDGMADYQNKNFYTVLGNHDVVDVCNRNADLATVKYVKSCVTDEDVIVNDKGYYYKDFQLPNKKTLRLIAMNCFEYDSSVDVTGSNVVISKDQIDWLVGTLKSTPSDGYIMIAMHTPVGDKNGFVESESNFQEKPNIENATINNELKKYATEDRIKSAYETYISKYFTPKDGEFDPALVPEIVNAYLTRDNFVKKASNTGSISGSKFDLDLDFTNCNPAKFLCYLAGHVHVDLTNYLKTYPNQLVNDIACTNDDRIRKDVTVFEMFGFSVIYNINSEVNYSNPMLKNVAIDKITLDLDKDDIVIERIGRDTDKNGEKIRDKQTFHYAADIDDTEEYTKEKDQFYTVINYNRNFTTDAWQALYLPFPIKYEDWVDKAEIAEFTGLNDYDDDNDGVIDRTTLCFEIIENGETKPNTPYLIKPNQEGEMKLTVANTTLIALSDVSIPQTSENGMVYTLYGNHGVKSDMFEKGYYALLNGKFVQASKDGLKLNPHRIYLGIENPNNAKAPKLSIAIRNSEVAGIISLNAGNDNVSAKTNGCYNLAGQRVSRPVKGIYIINGKKLVK